MTQIMAVKTGADPVFLGQSLLGGGEIFYSDFQLEVGATSALAAT